MNFWMISLAVDSMWLESLEIYYAQIPLVIKKYFIKNISESEKKPSFEKFIKTGVL